MTVIFTIYCCAKSTRFWSILAVYCWKTAISMKKTHIVGQISKIYILLRSQNQKVSYYAATATAAAATTANAAAFGIAAATAGMVLQKKFFRSKTFSFDSPDWSHLNNKPFFFSKIQLI